MIESLRVLLEPGRDLNAVMLALGSFLVYAVVSNLATFPLAIERLGALGTWRSVVPKSGAGAIIELLRFGFYVGIPFLALQLGWIDLRVMGLGLLDWAEGVRWAIVILLAAWLVLMVIWLPYLRSTADILAPSNANLSFPRRLVELIYMQSHWAFYRAVAIGYFIQIIRPGVIPTGAYWGAAVGLGLVFVEAMTNPRIRERLGRVGEADLIVWNMGQAVINTLAFIVTGNLFLLVLIQFVLELTVPHLRAAPRPQSKAFSPPAARR